MPNTNILKGKKICIDPGHGGTAKTDFFRQGPTGEREEWINLRVGLMLKDLLERAGATVVMTRTEDKFVELKDRADMAIKAHCDLFISIHHEGTAQDNETNYPIVFYFKYANQNPASVDFAKILLKHIQEALGLPKGEVYSDWTILPNSGTAVLRLTNSYMPGVIGEASYFTNPEEEQRLKQKEYNQKEAQAYLDAITEYFSKGIPSAVMVSLKPGQAVTELRPSIQFQLNDGLGGKAMDSNSIRVNWNGQFIGKSYQAKSGIVSILPTEFTFGEQTVKIFARNNKGQAIHPSIYVLKTGGELAKSLNAKKKILEKTKQNQALVLNIIQVEPKQGNSLDEKKPMIALQIQNAKEIKTLDTTLFDIYFNYRKVPYQYNAKLNQIRLSPGKVLRTGKQTLTIFSIKDISGQPCVVNPDSFSFQWAGATTHEKKEWLTAFENGKKIVEGLAGDTVNKLTNEDKETLLKGIDNLARSLDLFHDSPMSGKAVYLMGVAFEKLAEEPYYKEQAITSYTHVLEYYPTLDLNSSARTALRTLKYSNSIVPDL